MQIPNELEREILSHAKQSEPQESCGFVVSEYMHGHLYYLPCKNVASDPVKHFEVSPDDLIHAEEVGHIIALVHSHPNNENENGLPYLSVADRECQLRLGCDFWLVVGEKIKQFRNIPPLLGRDFENCKQDCRSIVMDCYMLAGVEILDCSEYEFNWFERENLYEEGMQRCGFHRLMHDDDIQLGDIILFQVGSKVANHAAVYLGNQMLLHHSQGRLSSRVPYDGFWLNVTHSVWRFKEWYKLNFTAILNDLQARR